MIGQSHAGRKIPGRLREFRRDAAKIVGNRFGLLFLVVVALLFELVLVFHNISHTLPVDLAVSTVNVVGPSFQSTTVSVGRPQIQDVLGRMITPVQNVSTISKLVAAAAVAVVDIANLVGIATTTTTSVHGLLSNVVKVFVVEPL